MVQLNVAHQVRAQFSANITAGDFATNFLHITDAGGGHNSVTVAQFTASSLAVTAAGWDVNSGGRTWVTNSTPPGIIGGTGTLALDTIQSVQQTGAAPNSVNVTFLTPVTAADFAPDWLQLDDSAGSDPSDGVTQVTANTINVTGAVWDADETGFAWSINSRPSYVQAGGSGVVT